MARIISFNMYGYCVGVRAREHFREMWAQASKRVTLNNDDNNNNILLERFSHSHCFIRPIAVVWPMLVRSPSTHRIIAVASLRQQVWLGTYSPFYPVTSFSTMIYFFFFVLVSLVFIHARPESRQATASSEKKNCFNSNDIHK